MVESITAAMREGDWGAVLRLMHAQGQGPTAEPVGASYDLPPFYREFGEVYRQLYEIYRICNYHGWGGALPPVALVRSLKGGAADTARISEEKCYDLG